MEDRGAGLRRRAVATNTGRPWLTVLTVFAVVAGLVAGVIWRAEGSRAAVARTMTGSLWLANEGWVTLVDGTTNEAVWKLSVAAPGTSLRVLQLATGAIVLDEVSGTITSISSTRLTASSTASITPGPTEVGASDGMVYVVPGDARENISRRDPQTLASVAELPVSGGASSAVDDLGRLWLFDRAGERLHLVDGAELVASPSAPGAAAATMVAIRNGVALVEPDGKLTRVQAAPTARPIVEGDEIDLAPAGWVAVHAVEAPPDGLVMLDPERARLAHCPNDAGCAVLSLAPHLRPGDGAGTPWYFGGVVFVPNHTRGTVVLVDPATNAVTDVVEVLERPAPFELVSSGADLWFNNPATNEAGRISPDGRVTSVRKYPDDLSAAQVVELASVSGPVGELGGISGNASPSGGGATGATADGAGGGDGAIDGALGELEAKGRAAERTPPITAPAAERNAESPAPLPTPPATVPPADVELPEGPAPAAGPQAAPDEIDAPQEVEAPAVPTENTVTEPEAPPPDRSPRPQPVPVTAESTGGPGANELLTDDRAAADPQPTPPPQTQPGGALAAVIGTSATVTEPDTPVTFEDRSTGEPTSRTWSFGDGATSTERRPTHRWRTPGRYRVTLSVARGDERADTALTVVVSDGLLASFSAPGSAETGQPVTFTNQSTGDIAEYRWDFGDGSAGSTERSPSHVYRSAGRYTVRLTVVGAGGATDSASHTIEARNPQIVGAYRVLDAPATVEVGGEVAVSIEVTRGAPVTVAVASGPCRLVRRDLDGAVARHIVGATAPGPCALDLSQPTTGDVTGAPAQTVNLTAVAPPTAQNRPPEVRGGRVVVRLGETRLLTAADLGASDPDGDPLTFTVTASNLPVGALNAAGTPATARAVPGGIELAANGYGTGSFDFTAGDGSATSATARMDVDIRLPPPTLSAEAGDGSVTLTVGGFGQGGWTAVINPGAIRVTRNSSPYTHTGLTNGTTYSVYAVMSDGRVSSDPSPTLQFTPQAVALAAPTSVVARVDYPAYQHTRVTWTPVPGAESYTVFKAAADGQSTVVASGVTDPVAVGDFNYFSNSHAPGTPVSFTVVATRGSETSTPSTPSNECTFAYVPPTSQRFIRCDGQPIPVPPVASIRSASISATGATILADVPSFDYPRVVGATCETGTGAGLAYWHNREPVNTEVLDGANGAVTTTHEPAWDAQPPGTQIRCKIVTNSIIGSESESAWTAFTVV